MRKEEILNNLKNLHTQVVLNRDVHSLDTLLGLTDAIRSIEEHLKGVSTITMITPILDRHVTYETTDPILLDDILIGLCEEFQTLNSNDSLAILSGIHAIELYLYDEVRTASKTG